MFDHVLDQEGKQLSRGLKASLQKIKLMPEMVQLGQKLRQAQEQLAQVDRALNDGEYAAQFFEPGKPVDEKEAANAFIATGVLPDLKAPGVDVGRELLHSRRRILQRSVDMLEAQQRKLEQSLITSECKRLMPIIQKELLGPALEAAENCVSRLEAMRELFFALSHHGMGEQKRPMILQDLAPGYRSLVELKTYVRTQNELLEKGIR